MEISLEELLQRKLEIEARVEVLQAKIQFQRDEATVGETMSLCNNISKDPSEILNDIAREATGMLYKTQITSLELLTRQINLTTYARGPKLHRARQALKHSSREGDSNSFPSRTETDNTDDCIYPYGIEYERTLGRCSGYSTDLKVHCPECPDCDIGYGDIVDWLRLNYATWPTSLA